MVRLLITGASGFIGRNLAELRFDASEATDGEQPGVSDLAFIHLWENRCPEYRDRAHKLPV
jgi:hypothetical protein